MESWCDIARWHTICTSLRLPYIQNMNTRWIYCGRNRWSVGTIFQRDVWEIYYSVVTCSAYYSFFTNRLVGAHCTYQIVSYGKWSLLRRRLDPTSCVVRLIHCNQHFSIVIKKSQTVTLNIQGDSCREFVFENISFNRCSHKLSKRIAIQVRNLSKRIAITLLLLKRGQICLLGI